MFPVMKIAQNVPVRSPLNKMQQMKQPIRRVANETEINSLGCPEALEMSQRKEWWYGKTETMEDTTSDDENGIVESKRTDEKTVLYSRSKEIPKFEGKTGKRFSFRRETRNDGRS